MRLFLLASLFSFSIFADDCVSCLPEFLPDTSTHNLEEFSNRLEHWSANNDQVMNSPCKNKTFNTDEMNRELSSLAGTKDKKIRGVRFDNENPELLKVFNLLTTKSRTQLSWFQRLFGRGNSSGETDFQELHSINPECKKVLCAVDKIWGRETGRKLLFMQFKFGYNGSDYVHRNAARYSESELDDILMGLSDLPKSIVPLQRERQLTKYLPSIEFPDKGPTVWADSAVRMYAPWFRGPPGLRFQTLIHEVGHNLNDAVSPEVNRQWESMSAWVKAGDKWEFDAVSACMPSRYAMTSPREDFSETVAAYRYNGRALLAQCPDKYRFMKDNVFRGVEYREESQCTGR